MSKRQEQKAPGGILSYLKRRPTLLSGLIVLLVAIVLLGGQSLASNTQEKSTDTASSPTIRKKVVVENNTNTADSQAATATVKDGVQYITSTVSAGQYEPIIVQQGLPVKWTLNAPSDSLNGCNNTLIIPEYNLEIKLKPGENLIEFTPDQSGTFAFSCWMGMIRSSISVLGKDGTVALTQKDGSSELPASCCGG